MSLEQRFWAFLKQQQERIVLVVSLATLVVGIINSLLDNAHPPVLNLAIFSAFVVGYCVWMVLARDNTADRSTTQPFSPKRRYSTRQVLSLSLGAIIVLAGAWSFIYREQIRYSKFLTNVAGGPRVLVSDTIAWQLLAYKTPTGDENNTVVGELASLLSGLPYRIVVFPGKELDGFKPDQRDRALFRGVAEESDLVIKSGVWPDQAQALKIIDDLLKEPEVKGSGKPSLPAKRLYDITSLAKLFTPTVPLSKSLNREHHASITRLLLRYTLGMALYTDNDPQASRLFLDMVDIGELLPPVESPAVANLYFGVAFFFAQHDGRLDTALRAIRLARSMASTNQRISATYTWLLLTSGQTAQAKKLLKEQGGFSDDPALGYWLEGDYFSAVHDHDSAIQLYEKALQQERDAEMRPTLHFHAAFAYAMSGSLEQKVAAAGIIRHLEDAIQLSDNGVFHAIQGYGWALQGNLERFNSAFARANSLIPPSLPAANREFFLVFLAQWQAKSLLKLEQPLLAKAAIETFVGNPKESKNVGLLLDFGRTLLDVAGFTGQPEEFEAAEKYFDRIIELEPENGRAHHYKGYALAMRSQNSPEPEVQKKQSLRDGARRQLLQAIRFGYELPVTHTVLAKLYEADGDVVNAEKHQGRYCELSATDTECLIRRAENLVKAGDVPAAKEAFAKLRETRALPDAEVLLREGINWQLAGKLLEAERAYLEALRIEPDSYDGHDNLAFVLLDLGRLKEALGHWEKAVQLDSKQSDALAGRAIALQSLGNRRAALVAYKAATERNKSFLDCRLLQEEFFWSDRACKAATPLIEAIRKK